MYIAGFPRMLFLRKYIYILKTSIDTSQATDKSHKICVLEQR